MRRMPCPKRASYPAHAQGTWRGMDCAVKSVIVSAGAGGMGKQRAIKEAAVCMRCG